MKVWIYFALYWLAISAIPACMFAQADTEPSAFIKEVNTTATLKSGQDAEAYHEPDSLKYKTVIKTNPFALIGTPVIVASEYRVMLERQIAPQSSVYLGSSYLSINLLGALLYGMDFDDITRSFSEFSGFRLQGGYKYYFKSKAPAGSYIGPYFSYINLVNRDEDTGVYDETQGNSVDRNSMYFYNVDFVYGYQYVADSGFTFDVCTGLGYKGNSIADYIEENEVGVVSGNFWEKYAESHFKFVLHFNFGYRF